MDHSVLMLVIVNLNYDSSSGSNLENTIQCLKHYYKKCEKKQLERKLAHGILFLLIKRSFESRSKTEIDSNKEIRETHTVKTTFYLIRYIMTN